MSLGKKLKIFTGHANIALAQAVARQFNFPTGDAHLNEFPDGRFLAEYDENVRGHHVAIIQPTTTLRDHVELCQMVYAAASNSAANVTAVVSYFGDIRADRKKKRRVGVVARMALDQVVRAGAKKILLVDPHFEQIEGYVDPRHCQIEILHSLPVFVSLFRQLGITDVMNGPPDVGRAKTAEDYSNALGGDIFFAYKVKKNDRPEKVHIIGDVAGRNVRVIDDECSTGETIQEVVLALEEAGAAAIDIVVTHGKFVGDAPRLVAALPLVRKVSVTDTVALRPEVHEALGDRLRHITIAPLLAAALRSIHNEDSVAELEDCDKVAEIYRREYFVNP